MFRVLSGLLAAAALAGACTAALDDGCPAGSTRVAGLCVPDRQTGDCDGDHDDFLALACGGDDCDDDDPNVHPGAVETADGRDDDCDGDTDEDLAPRYADADGDGFGAPGSSCAAPSPCAAVAGDCDDSAADVHPGAVEGCNGRDDDCDGFTDEGVAQRFYRDDDHDGAGVLGDFIDACAAPSGYAAAPYDCDDAEPDAWPGQTRLFDHPAASGGWDYDCDGVVTRRIVDVVAACDTCLADLEGWLGAMPDCGTTGTIIACRWSSATGCTELRRTPDVMQECR